MYGAASTILDIDGKVIQITPDGGLTAFPTRYSRIEYPAPSKPVGGVEQGFRAEGGKYDVVPKSATTPQEKNAEREKQLAQNSPKLKELLLALHFQTMDEEAAITQLQNSSEKSNAHSHIARREKIREMLRSTVSDNSYEEIRQRYLGKELANLAVVQTSEGNFYIHSRELFSAQLWIKDGKILGRWPGQEWDAEFKSVPEAVEWFVGKLALHHFATRKEK
jgi:hypothetical protein